jgi:alpha-1,6-mannosyltransferase
LSTDLRKVFLYALGGGLLLLNLAALYFQTQRYPDGFLPVVLLQATVYLAAACWVGQAGRGGRSIYFILLVAVLLRVGPLLLPPYLSNDIYRYVWDGWVQGAGINPYRYIPSDEALRSLRDGMIYTNINRVGYARTIYPPAAEMIYFAVTRVGEGVTAMKLAMLAFDGGTIFLILYLLRRSGAPQERVLIYAWHPLTVWEIAGSGHVDSALCFLLTLAFVARQKRLPSWTGAALAGATLIKYFPVLLFPALYRRWDWRMPVAFVGAVVLLYLPYLSAGWNVLGFLPGYIAEEHFIAGGGFYWLNLLQSLSGQADPPVLAYALFAAAVLITAALFVLLHPWRGENGYAVGCLILALLLYTLVTPHYSWYFLWVLPILCLVPYWPALLLTAASFLLYQPAFIPAPSRSFVVNSLLYGSFLLAALTHLCVHRRRRPVAVSAAT